MVATATPTNDQLVKASLAGQDEGALKEQLKQRNAISEILKIVQEPNLTPETDLEGFQNQGGYAPEEESRTPGSLTPRQKGSNVKKGDAAQRKAEEARGGDQLKPEDIWPNYPKMNIKPQDMLKILFELIPAATGINLQMAKADDDYGPGSKKYPQTPGKPWQIADISDSIKRENVGGTLRDLVLPPAMKEYGKTPGGGYKNPGALLSIMKKLV